MSNDFKKKYDDIKAKGGETFTKIKGKTYKAAEKAKLAALKQTNKAGKSISSWGSANMGMGMAAAATFTVTAALF